MAGLLKSIFRRQKYHRYLVLGDSKSVLYWDYETWVKQVFPILDDLMRQAGCEPSVQCRQVTGPSSNEVKFGDLTWSTESSKAWCHGAAFPEREPWLFVDLQVFCPAKQVLVREDELPRIYVQVKPLGREDTGRKTKYDECVHLALDSDFLLQNASCVESVIGRLLRASGSLALYTSISPASALNAFESLVREDFVYRGIHLDEWPDVKKMRGNWSRTA